MCAEQMVCELTWSQILAKGYVFGIPFLHNGKFNDGTSNRDVRSIQRGVIHRFPHTLRRSLPYLYERSRCTSGIRIEFTTDAKSIQIVSKITYMKHRENYSNMAQGVIDLLVDGKIWSHYYPKWENPDKIYLPSSGSHRISLILPTYAGIQISRIILHNLTELSNRSPNYLLENRPIVYYGSSITQGGCSSRPSLSYPHQLSEIFCMNYVNLGISGNAHGESEIAQYISSSFSYAAMFVLDWGANLLDPQWENLLEQRYEPFWRIIHKSNPNIPILFVGLQNYSYDVSSEPETRARIQQKREFIQASAMKACVEINQDGKRKLFDYIDGTTIIDTTHLDLTVDGVHPNDIGHKIYAELLEWKIIDLLGNHIKVDL